VHRGKLHLPGPVDGYPRLKRSRFTNAGKVDAASLLRVTP
jgi:hypothetical protein